MFESQTDQASCDCCALTCAVTCVEVLNRKLLKRWLKTKAWNYLLIFLFCESSLIDDAIAQV